MTSHSWLLLERRILRVVGFCGVLAFLVSFASYADDEVQQECMAGRGRHEAEVCRLLKATHRDFERVRLRLKAVPTRCFQPGKPPQEFAEAAIHALYLPAAVLANHTGDRSPPLNLPKRKN